MSVHSARSRSSASIFALKVDGAVIVAPFGAVMRAR